MSVKSCEKIEKSQVVLTIEVGAPESQHLRRKKISRQPTDRRCTKAAAHTAACLRRNTDGISVFISHQDTLDHISIRKAEQILSGSIYFGGLNIQSPYFSLNGSINARHNIAQ